MNIRLMKTIHKFEFIRFQNILKTTDGKPAPGRKHQDRETPHTAGDPRTDPERAEIQRASEGERVGNQRSAISLECDVDRAVLGCFSNVTKARLSLFAAGFFVIFAVAVASAYGWLGGAP